MRTRAQWQEYVEREHASGLLTIEDVRAVLTDMEQLECQVRELEKDTEELAEVWRKWHRVAAEKEALLLDCEGKLARLMSRSTV